MFLPKNPHLPDPVARLRDLAESIHGLRLLLHQQVRRLSAAGRAEFGEGLEAELFPVGVDGIEHLLRLGLGYD